MTKDNFIDMIKKNYLEGKEIVLFNVGSQKINGDSFGPLLGSILKDKLKIIKIYGTLDDTITALNVLSKEKYVKNKHKNSFVIATDAMLTNIDESLLKDFLIKERGVKPRAALEDPIEKVIGDISILFPISKNIGFDIIASLRLMEIKKVYNKVIEAEKLIKEIDNILYDLKYEEKKYKM